MTKYIKDANDPKFGTLPQAVQDAIQSKVTVQGAAGYKTQVVDGGEFVLIAATQEILPRVNQPLFNNSGYTMLPSRGLDYGQNGFGYNKNTFFANDVDNQPSARSATQGKTVDVDTVWITQGSLIEKYAMSWTFADVAQAQWAEQNGQVGAVAMVDVQKVSALRNTWNFKLDRTAMIGSKYVTSQTAGLLNFATPLSDTTITVDNISTDPSKFLTAFNKYGKQLHTQMGYVSLAGRKVNVTVDYATYAALITPYTFGGVATSNTTLQWIVGQSYLTAQGADVTITASKWSDSDELRGVSTNALASGKTRMVFNVNDPEYIEFRYSPLQPNPIVTAEFTYNQGWEGVYTTPAFYYTEPVLAVDYNLS